MAVSERDRHRFYETARAKLGEAEADYLMEVLPPVGWESKLDAFESKLDAKLTRLEARLIRANIASMIGLAGLVLAAGAVI